MGGRPARRCVASVTAEGCPCVSRFLLLQMSLFRVTHHVASAAGFIHEHRVSKVPPGRGGGTCGMRGFGAFPTSQDGVLVGDSPPKSLGAEVMTGAAAAFFPPG